MKSKVLGLLLMTLCLSQFANAGGAFKIPPTNDGTITLSQDAQDIARFGCLSRPNCQRNFTLSTEPCEHTRLNDGYDCYACMPSPSPEDAKQARCLVKNYSLSWNSLGYVCKSVCYTDCLSRYFRGEISENELRQCSMECPQDHIGVIGIGVPGCSEGFTKINYQWSYDCRRNVDEPIIPHNYCACGYSIARVSDDARDDRYHCIGARRATSLGSGGIGEIDTGTGGDSIGTSKGSGGTAGSGK